MSKSLIQSQFGKRAEAYATSAVHAKGASLKRLIELTKPEPDWRVLDVATGAGHTALAFAPHVAAVVASDLTTEMLEVAARLAKERGFANVTVQEADAEALPFADETFDLVTSRIAPHRFPDPGRFVAEAARVLKPGGLFALDDNAAPDAHIFPDFSEADLEAAAKEYNAFEKLRDPSHARALTVSEWQQLFSDAALDVLHWELLAKEMAFENWVNRFGPNEDVKAELRNRLENASPALLAFLKPEPRDGDIAFTFTEAILIGRKST